MRTNNAFEATHGGAAIAFLTATLAGWTVQEWAAFAALVYSLLLIIQRLYMWVQAWRKARATP